MTSPTSLSFLIKTVLALFVLLTAVAYTVWLERKLSAHAESLGPTRVGPFGCCSLCGWREVPVQEDLTRHTS